MRAVEFEGPDRVPTMHQVFPGAFKAHGDKLRKILRQYPDDFVWESVFGMSHVDPRYRKGTFVDEWGCVWENRLEGVSGLVVQNPLKDADSLDSLVVPDPFEVCPGGIDLFDKIGKALKNAQEEKYSQVDYLCLFERMQWLRGYVKLMTDFLANPSFVENLISKIVGYNLERIKRWNEMEVDAVYFGDDWGTQKGLMISPATWRKFFKPAYEEMFDLVHKGGKHVSFHTDGYTLDIIPDLIEIGADILNVQSSIMGNKNLGEKFGGKVCFRSDLDRQRILPFGTPGAVRLHVMEIYEAFAKENGGLIAAGEIIQDVPLDNIVAMYEAFKEFAYYHVES
jgi:uroporphyrinogen decarboxylase